ncbi:FecR family protein [Arenibacter certesii]|uniref:FecR protein domain-containing protein n=1 Tax=Arenibacter certesii TaxID=228955 RepID=A0A918IRV2_9FLAO|nr:FecR domain-containing protein [Arenibacter certesii]GGW29060.1 hypothetical protein GCM10007383_13080 [Arenibacter certesii]
MLDHKISKYLRGTATSHEEREVEKWIIASDNNVKKFNLLQAKYVVSTLDISNTDLDPSYYIIINKHNQSSKNKSRVILEGSEKDRQVIYKDKGTQKAELVYNTLSVPNGERVDLMLSDGTKVILNSGTSLRYPVQFLGSESRQVFLDGEAFFMVAKDSHSPFVVNTEDIKVRVLATKFNWSSYPEDQFVNTTLIEGSISVYNSSQTFDSSNACVLEPGHKAE